MYVLAFVDNINDSFGVTSLDDFHKILRVSDSVAKLKKFVDREYDGNGISTKWKKDKNSFTGKEWNRFVGETFYEGVFEEDQYFVIVKVKEIK